jgi:nucleotide-binding universal stress UspA family protein
MFEDILVPTDGSDCAAAAVEYAAELASRYGARVYVLSVVDSRPFDDMPHRETVEAAAEETVAAVRDDLADAGVTAETAVRVGIPHREVLDYADENGVDLVAMGTHGRTGVERYLLGSVTEKVVRLSDVPVLTVPGSDGADTRFSEVLVPTDGSEQAEAAVDVGADVADTYGARLHALAVVEPMSLGLDVRSEILADALGDAAQAAVERVAERATAAGVTDVETTVRYGYPYREVLDYVDDNDVDLVAMGTHGRTGIARYLLGSVTEKVVRTAGVPVLTVRAPGTGES